MVVEAASNPAFPMLGRRNGHLGSLSTAGDQPIYSLRQASLAVRDDDVFHLLLDIEVLLGLYRDEAVVLSAKVTGVVPNAISEPGERFGDVLTWRLADVR